MALNPPNLTDLSGTSPPFTPGVTEELLTGARLLRRAFLQTPLHHAERGSSVIRAGERDASLLLIRRGFAFRYHTLANGSRAIVDVLIPGDIAGIDLLLVAQPSGEFAAVEQLSYNSLTPNAVRKLMRAEPSVAMQALALYAQSRWRIERLATSVMRLDAQARLAAFLLNLHHRLRRSGLINGLSFNLPMTQEQIADHLGLTLVHVNRTIRRMREERLLLLDRHVVIIMDPDRLQELLRGVSEPADVPGQMLLSAPGPLSQADGVLRQTATSVL